MAMKVKKDVIDFLVEELLNIVQLLTLPVLVMVFIGKKSIIGSLFTGALGSLIPVYLEVKWSRYSSKKITRKWWIVTSILCGILFVLMIIVYGIEKGSV